MYSRRLLTILPVFIMCVCALAYSGCSYGRSDDQQDSGFDANDADAGQQGDDAGPGDDGEAGDDGGNGDDGGPGDGDAQNGDKPVDCRLNPCPEGYYCNLNTGECLPGCASDSDCSPGEVCNTITHECIGACADCIVINEIDYDQPSTDAAEFIELLNKSNTAVSLGSFVIEMLNGNGNSVYRTIELPSVLLDAGDYYVICGDPQNVPNCDLDASPDTNLIQNGAPDALAVLLVGEIVDALAYEGDTGTPHTEGSGVGLEDLVQDPGTGGDIHDMGLSRCPNGADTNVNNVDFTFRAITPGTGNSCP